MNRLWPILLLCLTLATACAQVQPQGGLFGGAGVPTFAPPPGAPVVVTVEELVADPAVYAGRNVQVSGRYRRPSLFVCEAQLRRSPAAWALSDGENAVGAAGYDDLLRSLLPEGIMLTVEGRWLLWEGPVGCGKDAPQQEVWYLAVREVIAPQPLVRVTLTPVAGGQVATPIASQPSPTSSPTIESEGTPLATPTLTPSPTGSASTISSPSPTPTGPLPATETATATATTSPDETPSLTPTPTATGDETPATTGTVTATPTNGTPLPTQTGATPTPSPTASVTPEATATESSGSISDQGSLTFEPLLGSPADFKPTALTIGSLGSNEGHRWQVQVNAGDVITASAVAEPGRDIVLQLRDATGNVLVTANERGNGETETVAGYTATSAGSYQLVVREASEQSTNYALLYLNSEYQDYYRYVLADALPSNGSRSLSVTRSTDTFWPFLADAGDTVSITVSPNDSSDPLLNLLDPKRSLIRSFINDAEGGESEFILNAPLSESGLFLLHVGEYDYAQSNYTVTISGN